VLFSGWACWFLVADLGKRLLIEISLVEESERVDNMLIVDDVFEEISRGFCLVPWCARVEKVAVVEA
jgi:hypothetical protein